MKVQQAYNTIAKEFSQTRQYPWPEFKLFTNFLSEGDTLLDLGCGNGRLYDFLQPFNIQYTGFDVSEGLIQEAQKKHSKGKFILGDMKEHLPFPDDSFNHVWAIASFHHLQTSRERHFALQEMYRVLKPKGFLIMMVWNLHQKKYIKELCTGIWNKIRGKHKSRKDLLIPWKRKNTDPVYRYYHAFTPRELKGYIKKNDFSLLDMYYTRKGEKTTFLKSFNIVCIAKKQ